MSYDDVLYDYSNQCINGNWTATGCACNNGWFNIPGSPYLCAWPSDLAHNLTNFDDQSIVAEEDYVAQEEQMVAMLKTETQAVAIARFVAQGLSALTLLILLKWLKDALCCCTCKKQSDN